MKVILLKDIAKVGKKYEIKEISDGYALNMLIPHGSAISATPDAIKKVEAQKKQLDAERAIQDELLHKNLKALSGITVTVTGKANEKGHLFAGFHQKEIADALAKNAHINVDPLSIDLSHAIKTVGEHEIKVSVGNKSALFKLVIKAE
jgi:large subunit ribosomal protein L9